MPPPTLDMAQRLIAVPSVSSPDPRCDQSNRGVVDLLGEWTEGLGARVALQEVKPGKWNLIAHFGPAIPGAGLVLSGHTDTVPCNESHWSLSPFAGEVRDGRLYGLGSADMKSFFALVLSAAAALPLARLTQPLTLLATCDEESTMDGARALAEAGRPLGHYAVIGEPTGLRPIRMHKGVMSEAVQVDGIAGHASDPARGANAIDGMARVLDALSAWRRELAAEHRHDGFEVPHPTLNFGAVHGGDSPNRICATCRLALDIRLLPGMGVEATRAALHRRLDGLSLPDPRLRWSCHPLSLGVPPFETAPDADLVSAAEALSGTPAGAVGFGTEAPFLQRLGLETVVLGAGHIEQAHRPDEYLDLAQMERGIELYRRLIERYCLSRQAVSA